MENYPILLQSTEWTADLSPGWSEAEPWVSRYPSLEPRRGDGKALGASEALFRRPARALLLDAHAPRVPLVPRSTLG